MSREKVFNILQSKPTPTIAKISQKTFMTYLKSSSSKYQPQKTTGK